MRMRSLGSLAALLLLLCAGVAAAGGEAGMSPVGYTPEPELEELIQQTQHTDKFVVENAIDKLAKIGKAAEDALQAHLFKEATPGGQMKWAELLARCGRGQLGYRVFHAKICVWRDKYDIALIIIQSICWAALLP